MFPVLILANEGFGQAEDPDLLRPILVSEKTREIVHFSSLTGVAADISEASVPVIEIHNSTGNSRNDNDDGCKRTEGS